MEIQKLWPDVKVTGVACPQGPNYREHEADSPGADYFVKKRIDHIMRLDPEIDTVILAVLINSILMSKILKHVPVVK